MIYSALKGRIGNNLFQVATGFSLAKKNKTEFAAYIHDILLPEPDNCTLREYINQFKNTIFRNVNFVESLPANYETYHEPPDLSFLEINSKDNLIIDGYFQSEKYFDKELIRNLYSMDDDTGVYINNKYGSILKKGITSINVRRGDFVKQPHLHPACSMKYYKAAISYFGAGHQFMIISDDSKWCKKHFKGGNYFFIEEEPPVIDLYLQTLCKNNILSNSSFSWWGAWLNLNPDKIVIAPAENWVGKHHSVSTKDLLPGDWIKITNPIEIHLRLVVFYHDIIKFLVGIKRRIKAISWKK